MLPSSRSVFFGLRTAPSDCVGLEGTPTLCRGTFVQFSRGCSSPWTRLMSLCLLLPSKMCICIDNSHFLLLLKGRKVLGHRQVKAMHFRGAINLRHICISSSEPLLAALHGVMGCLSSTGIPQGLRSCCTLMHLELQDKPGIMKD